MEVDEPLALKPFYNSSSIKQRFCSPATWKQDDGVFRGRRVQYVIPILRILSRTRLHESGGGGVGWFCMLSFLKPMFN